MKKKIEPEHFEQVVKKHWTSHVECLFIGWGAEIVNNSLEVIASPVFREVYGGEGDGTLTWAPFTFDLTEFGKEPGIEIEDVLIDSVSQLCDQGPVFGVRGKFEGATFVLIISLQPLPKSRPKELLDTIHNQLREIEDWEQR